MILQALVLLLAPVAMPIQRIALAQGFSRLPGVARIAMRARRSGTARHLNTRPYIEHGASPACRKTSSDWQRLPILLGKKVSARYRVSAWLTLGTDQVFFQTPGRRDDLRTPQ